MQDRRDQDHTVRRSQKHTQKRFKSACTVPPPHMKTTRTIPPPDRRAHVHALARKSNKRQNKVAGRYCSLLRPQTTQSAISHARKRTLKDITTVHSCRKNQHSATPAAIRVNSNQACTGSHGNDFRRGADLLQWYVTRADDELFWFLAVCNLQTWFSSPAPVP